VLLLSPFLPRRIGASVFVRADEKEFFDRGRDRNCFAQQDDTGASGTSREASKVCSIVRRSWLTRIRPESAVLRRTSGSSKPARPASAAVRISISGAARRNPRRTRPSRSASAWYLTRTTRPLQLRNQLRVGVSRLLVLQFRCALSFHEVVVDILLVREVERERAVHLLKG